VRVLHEIRPQLDPPDVRHHGLSEVVATLVGSEILRIAAEVRTLRESGRAVCDLTVGDFAPRQFRIPEPLREGIVRALAAGQTHYPPSDGIGDLRRAVQVFYQRALGLDYPLEGILIAGGARPIIWGTYAAVVEPGDRVVYPVPSWNNNHYAHLARAEGIAVPTRPENGFLPTAEEIAPALRGARLLALNSPLNPAGTGFGRAQLEALARLVVEENRRRGPSERPLFLLYDQIYWLLASDHAPHSTPVELVPEVAPYTVLVDGISKAFAATGLRVGWTVGPPYLVARMRDLLGHVGAWAPRPEQHATAEILARPELTAELAGAVRGAVLARLDALHDGLDRLHRDGLPVEVLPVGGGLYLSVRFDLVSRLGSNDAIRKYLLEEAGFAIVPFQAFGLADESGWFRVSVGAVGLDDIAAALPRLRAALAKLR